MIDRRHANPFKEDSAEARKLDLEDCEFEFQCQKKRFFFEICVKVRLYDHLAVDYVH